MKNKFILGLILTSVLLMSVIGVSAQITGNAVITGDIAEGGRCDGGGTYHYNIEAQSWLCVTGIDIKKDDSLRASSSSSVSADSARKSSSASSKRSSVLRGWKEVDDAYGGRCYVKDSSSKATEKVLGSLFYRTYSGNVVVTGEMTKETCNKMSSGKGTLGPSNMKCTYSTDVVMQSGRLCTMYEGKQVCGRAGEQVHANDGTSFVFKKERKGLGTPAITINVEATESVRQLPKYS